jgi:translation initiation factor IF-1
MKGISKTNLMLLLIMVTGVLCLSAYTLSAEESKGGIPDLIGSWKGKNTVAFPNGTNTNIMDMRIVKQEGPYFWSERLWRNINKDAPTGHIKGKKRSHAGEITLGVIDYDNKTIFMAEKDDGGIMKGKLIGKDKMEFIYIESGDHPVVMRTVLTREKPAKK